MNWMRWSRDTKKRFVERSGQQKGSHRRTEEGFTLIEIIASVVILSIVSGITLSFMVSSVKLYATTMNQKALFEEAKLALERMCREIRDAKAILSPAAGASASSLTFLRTHATAQDSANETITLRLTGTTLEKVKTAPSTVSPLADRVSTFTVTRGATEDEIKIVLGLSLSTGENITLQTKVYPKNLPKSSTYKHFYENWAEEIST